MADIRPVRILFFHPTYSFGGAERTSRNLFSSLNPLEFRIVLVSSKEISKWLMSPAIEKVIHIEDIGLGIWFDGIGSLLRDVKIASGLLRAEEPDMAFAMMHYASTFLVMAKGLSSYKGAVVSSPRGPSSDYLNTCFSHKRDRLYLRLLFKFFCRYSDYLVVPSEGTKRDCVERFGSIANRVYVIHNSVDADAVRSRAEEPLEIDIPGDLPIIASAGRLTMEKNLPLLFRAFCLLRKEMGARLLIIGEGNERGPLEDLAKELDIQEDVLFVGFQDNPHQYIKRATLYVHTCLVEGFGNVIVEAMACGLPVIATDCPYGPREIITHMKNGVLVPLSDEKALTEAMELLLKDRELRDRMSQNALDRAKDFSCQKMADRYRDIFMMAAGRRFQG